VSHKGNSIVTGIWAKDTTHGAITLLGADATFSLGGAIEHLSGPTTIDKIALPGYGNGFNMQNASMLGFFVTPIGLLAANDFGDQIFQSTDNGSTFTTLKTSLSGTPNAPQVFMGKDSAGVWHEMDDIGNVWFSATAPSATATWTRTWQPEATPPDPDPVPPQDCQMSFHQGYFNADAQQIFTMSADGKTMMYTTSDPAPGVCRSTDGGKNFLPVAFPNVPAAASMQEPYVLLMTTATHGIAAASNDLLDDAYAYTTDDGGATWKAATLPTTVTMAGVQAAIVSGFAAPDGQHVWLVGFSFQSSNTFPVVLKSSDAGSTWKDISASLATLPASATKLHTGFALDANNIWVGGEHGALFYSPSGGE
jgi:hypothetical protein